MNTNRTTSKIRKALGATAVAAVAVAGATAGYVAVSSTSTIAAPARPEATTTSSDGLDRTTSGSTSIVDPGSESSPGSVESAASIGGEGSEVEVLHHYGRSISAGGGEWTTMTDLLSFVVEDVHAFWANVVTSNGHTMPSVRYIFPAPGQAVATSCGTTNDFTAAYCSADDLITVNQEIATHVWNGTLVGPDGQQIDYGGDFGVAAIVAHEYAHNLQGEFGWLGAYPTPNTEKQADCLTGVWTADAERRNLLDPGDLEEGLKAFFLVGDSKYSSPDHHGTPQERMDAFWAGYTSGDGATCNAYLEG